MRVQIKKIYSRFDHTVLQTEIFVKCPVNFINKIHLLQIYYLKLNTGMYILINISEASMRSWQKVFWEALIETNKSRY